MGKSGLLLSFLALCHTVCAQMALDPAFGAGGMVFTSFGPRLEMAYNMVLQPDGKIIAVGNFDPELGVYDSDLMVIRYNSDGSVDSTFGTNGLTLVDVNGDEHAFEAVLQADGSIVVAGASYNAPGQDKLVMRFTPDGVLDPSFGNGGVVFIDDSFQYESLRALTLQPDEKIVVAGQSYNGTITAFYLARLNTDGSFDSTFSDDGKLELIVDTAGCFAMDLALQDDGRIVCVGDAGAAGDPAVVRLLPDGTLDSTFAGDGTAVIHWSEAMDYVHAVGLQPDGRVLVAGGDSSQSQASTFAVSRFMADGSVDSTFGVNGTVRTVTGLGVDTRCTVMAVDDNGGILLAGTFRPSAMDTRSYLCRLLDDGSLDPSFGAGGELIHSDPGMRESIWGMGIQPDGAIVLAGLAGESSTGNVLLMRYADVSMSVMAPSTAYDLVRVDAHGMVVRPAGSGTAIYQVTDALGHLVAQGSTTVVKNEERRIGFLSTLPTGTYLLNLAIAGKKAVTPFAVVGD